MNREEAKKLIKIENKETYPYGIIDNVDEIIDKIYDEFENEQNELKKENTRLKKQLSKDHHIGCGCSFCKPVDNQLKEDLQNQSTKEAIKILNNVLYFRDNSDYQTALFDALSKLTGINYDDFPNEFME